MHCPVNSVVRESVMFSNVIVDIAFPCHSFVRSQSNCEVSASLTDVGGVAVGTIDLIHCSLSVLRLVESKLNNLLPTSTHLQPITLENKEVPLLSQVVLNREAVSRKINPSQVKKSAVLDSIHLKLLRVLVPSQY